MKLISLGKLSETDIFLRKINCVYRTPVYQSLGSTASSQTGVQNGFLLIDRGSCRYQWQDHDVTLTRGALLYLPSTCRRTMTITEKPFSFWRINFSLYDAKDQDEIVFCNDPWVITENAAQIFFDSCAKLQRASLSPSMRFSCMAQLFECFEQIRRIGSRENDSRISAAVDFIQSHYNEDIDIKTLSELCYLSEPHLFRLFRRELGRTPVDYRNYLRIERAKALLSDDECSVGEIASMVGFDTIYYFSRVFRQYTGLSPTAFRSQIQGENLVPVKKRGID